MERARVRGVFGGEAWSLGRVSGIEVAVDRSWILIFGLITYSLASRFAAEQVASGAAQIWAAALLASLLFFTSIVLHELGHSLVAIRLGVGVRSITLFLFGGLAQLESEPRHPRDEILIAVAGPAVSVALGLVFLGLTALLPERPPAAAVLRGVFAWLGAINLVLAAFNVLPGFPLDGGRVLRGIVWSATGSFEQATRVAAASGSIFAYGLMFLGGFAALAGGMVLAGLWLVFIGWFLLTAAKLTVAQAALAGILERLRSVDVMDPVEDRCLSGAESVAAVAQAAVLQRGVRTLFVIDARGGLRGLVTLGDIARTPPERRSHLRVADVMRKESELVMLAPEETAWSAFKKMAESKLNQLPVVVSGRLVGAVTRERLVSLVQAGVALRP